MNPGQGAGPHRRAADALQRATGALSTAAMARMEQDMPWFRDLSAEDRSWVGMIVQAGIRGFVDWYRQAVDQPAPGSTEMVASVFGAAPRALAGVINLQQTVDLVRLSIEVVESNVEQLLDPADAADVRAAVLRYAREVAFATAEVYARAAEVRGAWDARLEALVVDAVLRSEADEALLSRASALGWAARGDVAVVLGSVPGARSESDTFDEVRRVARAAGMDALCAVQGDRLVVLLGGVGEPRAAAEAVSDLFGEGPVVVGPVAADLAQAHVSARAALSAHRAAPGWPEAPRPVRSADLLPERVLAGDGHARRHLVDEVYLPLVRARGTLIETIGAYYQHGSSIEATARALFVHPNTVRYRLRQVAELTGLAPGRARDAFTLEIALVLGRQSGRSARTPEASL
ncbi:MULTISPECIES: helix-turn-helix domain-containing protein [unclassified Nocardioides]|uniref:PucR family transcriptional regulator n=1 Tax=unclassified Nocardioides TaxID=2615069 RepID=UPI0000571B0C|nr:MULTISPECIES: helix-turn-helix domain-containing protein [unclassified Nocardioides]ABL81501.1 transcriptional regulator, CdaR family [Nocardioides sp. JS614]